MKSYIVPIVLALLVGFLLAKFMIDQYDKKEKLTTVFSSAETIYFIEQGVYTSESDMKAKVSDFAYYIYTVENNKYYVYIGMTKSKENGEKLKDFFNKKGYSTNIKEFKINNKAFVEILSQYDKLLLSVTEDSTIQAICSQVLSKYEELVLGDGEN